MQILIAPNVMQRLFDSAVTVIVSARAPVPQDLPVHLLCLNVIDEETSTLESSGVSSDQRMELAFAPVGKTLLFAFDEDDADTLETVREWWRLHSEDENVPDIVQGDLVEFHRQIAMLLADSLSFMEERRRDLEETLEGLRTEHHRASRAHSLLEEAVSSLHLSTLRMIRGDTPSDATLALEAAVTQPHSMARHPLGCPAAGIAAVDLHVRHGAQGRGFLNCSLVAGESGVELAHWNVAYDALQPGWFQFATDQAIAHRSQSVALLLHFVTLEGEPPEISLASEGSRVALRVWGTLPGVKTPERDHAIRPARGDFVEVQLGAAEIAKARKTRIVPAPFEYLQVLRGNRVLLHPVAGSLTSAMLPSVIPAGAYSVSAMAGIENSKCVTPVEFALAVSPAHHVVHEPEEDIRLFAFTGWQRIERPCEQHRLELHFGDPLAEEASVHLFTRAPGAKSVDYAQAIFQEFAVGLSVQRTLLNAIRDRRADLMAA